MNNHTIRALGAGITITVLFVMGILPALLLPSVPYAVGLLVGGGIVFVAALMGQGLSR